MSRILPPSVVPRKMQLRVILAERYVSVDSGTLAGSIANTRLAEALEKKV